MTDFELRRAEVIDRSGSAGRTISPEQAQLLAAVHLAIHDAPVAHQGAAQLATRVGAVLDATVVVLARSGREWTVLAESASRPREFLPIGGVAPYFSQLEQPEYWTEGGSNWTLIPCRLPAAPPLIIAIHGDWTRSIPTLRLLAHNLALSQLAVRTASRSRQHVATHRLARVLARTTGLSGVGQVIVDSMARAVDARVGVLALPDATNRTLSIVATHGYPLALVEPLRIDADSGALGTVFKTGRALHVKNAALFRSQPRHRYRTDSFVAIPIAARREIVGVVCVTDRVRDEPFTREHVSALRALAAPAALALGRERALLQAQAHAHAAAIDPVSGIFNRRYFHIRLEEELHRSRRHETPVALLMVDLDDFKVVNDSLGHLAGDVVLKDVAEILKHSIRVFDVCARFGGEEFAIIIPGSSPEDATASAERIRQRIEAYRPNDSALGAVRMTASVGLAVTIEPTTSRELITRADQALYAAKRAGKNCVRAN